MAKSETWLERGLPGGGYQPTPQNENESPRQVVGSTYSLFNIRMVLILLLFGFGISVSFVTGRSFSLHHGNLGTCQPNLNLPLQEHKFVFNESFVEPGPAADEAWKSLFPSQGGFFRHPTVSKERADFAVFHQLHCLDKIRLAYWALYDGSVTGGGIDPDSLSEHFIPVHITHCVELIRNALMCRPDTTVEIKDVEVNGVTGFEAEHSCVDWSQLVNWVSDWEDYNKPGI